MVYSAHVHKKFVTVDCWILVHASFEYEQVLAANPQATERAKNVHWVCSMLYAIKFQHTHLY